MQKSLIAAGLMDEVKPKRESRGKASSPAFTHAHPALTRSNRSEFATDFCYLGEVRFLNDWDATYIYFSKRLPRDREVL
jgi:hypothetical protein